MIKKVLGIMIVLLIVFSMTATAFCNTLNFHEQEMLLGSFTLVNSRAYDSDILPFAADIYCIGEFKQNSETKATAIFTGRGYEIFDKLTSTITLQIYSTSKGDYINTSAAPAVATVRNSNSITHKVEFQIYDGRQYRVKIVYNSVTDGVPDSVTYYRNMVSML